MKYRHRITNLSAGIALALMILPCRARACSVFPRTVHVGRSFRARATDHGRPIPGLRLILIWFDASQARARNVTSLLTDSDGFVDFRNLMPGSYVLSADHDAGIGDAPIIDVSPGGDPDVTVTLQWPSIAPIDVQSVRGQIRGPDYYPSQTQPHLSLSLLEGISGRAIATTQADNKGNFDFAESLPPGLYFLRLNPSGLVGWSGEPMEGLVGIQLGPDAKSKLLSLDINWSSCGLGYAQRIEHSELSIHRLCGQVTDGEGGEIANAEVLLMTAADSSKLLDRVRTDKRGQFAFPAAPSGSYELIVTTPGFQPFVRSVHLERGSSSSSCKSPVDVRMDVLIL